MRAHVVRVGPQGHAIELFVSEPQAMVAVADEVEVLTLDNLAALEARKPPVSAEVIARTQGALIGWQNADEFDAEELQEHGDVLRDATRALLAAVEAALEARKPPVSAEVIERARRWAQQLRLWPRRATPTEDGLRLIPEDCLRRCSAAFDALLAAVEAAPDEERLTVPPVKHRFAEWCGENFAAIWYEFSLLRDELGLPQPECDEEASGSAPAPTPDFDAMTPDDLSLEEVQALRDWLDERGRREGYENRSGRWHVLARERTSGNMIAYVADQPTERAALLALCQKVASSKAGA